MLLAPLAQAQERARDFIEPRITRNQFQKFVQMIGMESAEKQIAMMAFGDYESELKDLAERLDAEALAAGRQRVDDSLSGKQRIPADDLKQLRADVYRVYLQAGPEADAAMDSLLGGVGALLSSDLAPKFDAASRWLRRDIILHPRAHAATSPDYAGDGVDVLEMTQEAQAEGGELVGVPADALNPILTAYEHDLDAVLIATGAAERQGRLLGKIAGIEKDIEAQKREEQAALARWQQLYELNTRTVNRIAALAQQHAGDKAATQWQQRYDRESFAWLYPRRKPDRQIEWIRQQTDLAADTLQKAETIYSAYTARRDGLSRSAIDMMLRARLEFQTILYAMIDKSSIASGEAQSLYDSLIKNTGEQTHLESSTSSQLEALLDEPTRQALRDAMKRPDRTPPRPQTRDQ